MDWEEEDYKLLKMIIVQHGALSKDRKSHAAVVLEHSYARMDHVLSWLLK